MTKKSLLFLFLGTLITCFDTKAMQQPKVSKIKSGQSLFYHLEEDSNETISAFLNKNTKKIASFKHIKHEKARDLFAGLRDEFDKQKSLTKYENPTVYEFKNQKFLEYRQEMPGMGKRRCLLNKETGRTQCTDTMNEEAASAMFIRLHELYKEQNPTNNK